MNVSGTDDGLARDVVHVFLEKFQATVQPRPLDEPAMGVLPRPRKDDKVADRTVSDSNDKERKKVRARDHIVMEGETCKP